MSRYPQGVFIISEGCLPFRGLEGNSISPHFLLSCSQGMWDSETIPPDFSSLASCLPPSRKGCLILRFQLKMHCPMQFIKDTSPISKYWSCSHFDLLQAVYHIFQDLEHTSLNGMVQYPAPLVCQKGGMFCLTGNFYLNRWLLSPCRNRKQHSFRDDCWSMWMLTNDGVFILELSREWIFIFVK